MEEFANLQPELLWKFFTEICKIPRESKHEEKICKFLLDFGKQYNLKTKQDKTGNLLISKPATNGLEESQKVVLQSHVDMVCDKNPNVEHDFSSDPIIPIIDNGWVKATGTTLGADDGIGIAVQLAILASKDIPHGPLECLFTVDEETGLTGAFGLEHGFFEGKILINLDSEDEGELFIGCAGGVDTTAILEFKKREIPKKYITCKITVSGLKGGHSGDEIHKGRGNSIKILSRFLWKESSRYNIRISDLSGGKVRNAIPKDASAIISINRKHKDEFISMFIHYVDEIKKELVVVDPDLDITLEPYDPPEFAINKSTQRNLLNALYACPHGVMVMDSTIENFVETSTNLATVRFLENNLIEVGTSQRSSVESAKHNIEQMIEAVFKLAEAKVVHSKGYPGWKPDTNSKILSITETSYKKLFNDTPVARAIHAGLECGLFLDKYPSLDMISFGPTILDAHTPNERLNIETTLKFWNLLLDVLKNIPK